MIVADTSALISLTTVDLLDTFLTEFDVHTTSLVVEEIRETSDYNDNHAKASETVLNHLKQINIHQVDGELTSSRIDPGEGSCAPLTKEKEADFLITDDLHALPELKNLTDSKIAISPIVLKALVKRDVLKQGEATEKLEELAEERSWLGAPIYRKAKNLLEK